MGLIENDPLPVCTCGGCGKWMLFFGEKDTMTWMTIYHAVERNNKVFCT